MIPLINILVIIQILNIVSPFIESNIVLIIGALLTLFLSTLLYKNKRASIAIRLSNQQLMLELRKRRQSEKELKLSGEKFSKLFYNAPIPITYIRLFDRTIFDVNHAFEMMFGYDKNSILGKTTNDLGLWVNSDDWNNYYTIFSLHGEVNYLEVEVKTNTEEVKTCLISGSLIHLRDQDFIYAFFQDITKRKKTELALQQSESKYREIFNSVNDAIFIQDVESGTFVDANKKATELYKYTLEEFKNIDQRDFASNDHPFTYDELIKKYYDTINSDASTLYEWQAKDKYGKVFWVEISFKETIIENRQIVLSVIRDISERKKIEKLLIENEFLFRFQFNNSNLGIVIASTDNIFIRVNQKFCDIIGYSEEEVQGRSWIDITYADDLEAEIPKFNQMLLGETEGYEKDKRYVKKDGSLAYVHISVSCFRNPDKSIYYIIAYIFDITDRIEMDNKILKAIIGTEEIERTRFAQELHDGLGPILSSIKMYTQWMLKPGANIDQKDALLQIENLANIANQSVREIAFGLSPHILKDFGVTEALKSFIDRIKVDKNLPIEIKSNLSHRLDETTETIIYRILTECINNSLKHSEANFINIDLNETPEYLDIEYHDNGIGFDLDEIADKRLGMGLYNIQNRLKSINGKLLILSQPGKGTLIKINILL